MARTSCQPSEHGGGPAEVGQGSRAGQSETKAACNGLRSHASMVVLDAGGVTAQGVRLDYTSLPPAGVPRVERHLAGPRVPYGSAGEPGLHVGAPGAGLRLEGKRFAVAVSRPVADSRLPLAGLQFPEVRSSLLPLSRVDGLRSGQRRGTGGVTALLLMKSSSPAAGTRTRERPGPVRRSTTGSSPAAMKR